MQILAMIEAELSRQTSDACLVATVDVADWLSSTQTPPGLEHLPRVEQIFTWARQRGWSVQTTTDGVTILVTRNLYLENQHREYVRSATNVVIPEEGD